MERILVNQWTKSFANRCAGSAEYVLAGAFLQMLCSRQSIGKLHTHDRTYLQNTRQKQKTGRLVCRNTSASALTSSPSPHRHPPATYPPANTAGESKPSRLHLPWQYKVCLAGTAHIRPLTTVNSRGSLPTNSSQLFVAGTANERFLPTVHFLAWLQASFPGKLFPTDAAGIRRFTSVRSLVI